MVFAYSSRYPTKAKQKTEATSRVKVVSTRFDLSSFSAPDKKTQVQTYASYKPSLQLSSQNIPSRRIALIKLQAFHSFCLKRPTLHFPAPPIFPLNTLYHIYALLHLSEKVSFAFTFPLSLLPLR